MLPLAFGIPCVSAHASQVDGGFGLNVAALLVVLGVWAILMGVRNLRALRYRPMVPQRRQPPVATESDDE